MKLPPAAAEADYPIKKRLPKLTAAIFFYNSLYV